VSSTESATLVIGGEWTAADHRALVPVEDPSSATVVSSAVVATPADVDQAISAAQAGFRSWSARSGWERSSILRRAAELLTERADSIARTLTIEQGKPLRESRAEVLASAQQLDWFADEARRIYGRTVPAPDTAVRQMVIRRPIGPVAALVPWNFPLLLAARKVAPALAAGCSVIVKAPEEAPSVVFALARCLLDAGLEPQALSVLTGEPSDISTRLITSGHVKRISLTGSIPVARTLRRLAAEHLIDVSAELGGHAPVIIAADCDPVAVAKQCVASKFRNSGQVCIAPSRFYVHSKVAPTFTRAFVETTQSLRLGPGIDVRTQVGPLASRGRVVARTALHDDPISSGATAVR
jgi:succinate-semialdehyde dehydrogenase/glutarate-semialdehyde dehydrogenase